MNFTRSGLPINVKKQIAEHSWGSGDAVDEVGDYTPTNEAKMRRLRWIICRKELHDMLGLCSWMAPWVVSPNKSENYIGDDDMEARFIAPTAEIQLLSSLMTPASAPSRCIAPTPCAK